MTDFIKLTQGELNMLADIVVTMRMSIESEISPRERKKLLRKIKVALEKCCLNNPDQILPLINMIEQLMVNSVNDNVEILNSLTALITPSASRKYINQHDQNNNAFLQYAFYEAIKIISIPFTTLSKIINLEPNALPLDSIFSVEIIKRNSHTVIPDTLEADDFFLSHSEYNTALDHFLKAHYAFTKHGDDWHSHANETPYNKFLWNSPILCNNENLDRIFRFLDVLSHHAYFINNMNLCNYRITATEDGINFNCNNSAFSMLQSPDVIKEYLFRCFSLMLNIPFNLYSFFNYIESNPIVSTQVSQRYSNYNNIKQLLFSDPFILLIADSEFKASTNSDGKYATFSIIDKPPIVSRKTIPYGTLYNRLKSYTYVMNELLTNLFYSYFATEEVTMDRKKTYLRTLFARGTQ